MNLFTILVAGLFGLLTLSFLALLLAAIVFNLNVGRKYRRSLAQDIDKLRLSRMLATLGIDVTRYLHREPILDIQQQMKRCSECDRTTECDGHLAADDINAEQLDFCANEQSLKTLLERQPSATGGNS